MHDFFVSYTSSDESWAEWIAWALEEAKFTVVVQKWDFVAGSNFVLEMQRASANAKRTIAVLSPQYLKESRFGPAEWAAAFAKDPESVLRTLVPVRVAPCELDGLLKSIVYIDLVGVPEGVAKQRLLDQVKGVRLKPTLPPRFPGPEDSVSQPAFPNQSPKASPPRASNAYMPKISGKVTDIDRRRLIRDAFELIRGHFKASLDRLRERGGGVDFDHTLVDANTFTAEVFVGGSSRSRAKIWIGGMTGGDDIAYAEGRASMGSAMNEVLTLVDQDGDLALSAQMGDLFVQAGDDLDPKRLSAEDAAEFLWRRFASALERR